ncbi:MAG: response regulator [Rhodoferax sp.]|nr:response regulator [Rhodoferax sp.]
MLLVDDDLSLLRLHQIMLGKFLATASVDCVDNALEAMLRLELEVPDLVIVDLNMPGIDGFSLINLLASDSRYAGVARVALSGLNAKEVRQAGGLPTDVLVIQKPLDPKKMQRIRAHLGRQGKHQADITSKPRPTQPGTQANQTFGGCLLPRKKVLVVDDNPDIVRLLSITLSNEFEVLEAFDGESGLQALFQHHPKLVFLDIMMPGEINGLQLLEMIRLDPVHRRTWVGLISARGQKTDYVAAQAYGADAYFVKPFSPQQLLDWCRSKLA